MRGMGHLRSNAVAYVALLLALTGGVAWALERDTVKSRHIANGQVKPADLSEVYGAGVVMGTIPGLDNTPETFATPIGESGTDSSEQDRFARWPVFEDPTAKVTGFTVTLAGGQVAPGSQRRFDIRSDGANSGLSCVITEGESSCESTGRGTIDSGGGAAIRITNTGMPGSHLAQYGYLIQP